MPQPPSPHSRPVTSNQPGLHPRLADTVRRHQQAAWRKPPQAVDAPALATLDAALAGHDGPLVLDAFCGTGQSTALLAQRHPEALVVGIDQSAQRLSRHRRERGNYLLLQAHCEAIWHWLAERGRQVSHHYLLYPNPWPKAAQLRRRVHGHPSFPLLLALGGQLELRSNWQVYVEEFGVALHLCGIASVISCVPEEPAMTLFERKYRDSGHSLWRLRAGLTGPEPSL